MVQASHLEETALGWLLEPQDPAVRYLTLRDVMGIPADDPEVIHARQQAHTTAPITTILDAMDPEGYWVKAGPGYNPKYTSTVWSIILLAQVGALAHLDERIQKACSYLLDHALTSHGQFTTSGAPSGTADCLQGNLCAALLNLEFDDPRLDLAFDWMARSVTGEGVAPPEDRDAELRYYAGKCGPVFACGSNNKLACAWGGAKVMLAFSKLPEERRTPLIERAIEAGVEFFFGVDPVTADYPNGWADKPSGNWWKFGFPVFYVTDLLQVAEALVKLGYGHDPRLASTLDLILQKRDGNGHWAMEYDYTGKTWLDFGPKKKPNKWVTLRAMRVLEQVNRG